MKDHPSTSTTDDHRSIGQELYVLLSDRCNFLCAHCVNSAGPKSTRWTPTEESLASLADEINQSPEIKMLHFTGGEPTLFLPQIKLLLASLTRTIPLTLTTNGWFSERNIQYLDGLPLSSIIISHDRYHAPFVALEKLIPLVQYLKSQGKEVSFSFVFSDISELAELAPLRALDIPVHTSRIIKSGRAQWQPEWHDTNSIKNTCPSLTPEQRRIPELEKIVYISGKGFTPCCGPLMFDEMMSSGSTFTGALKAYASNHLLQRLRSGTFQQQGLALGFDLSELPFQSSCDTCSLLYGSIASGQPSIADIVISDRQNETDTIYFPFSSDLTQMQVRLLSQQYLVAYTEILDPTVLRSHLTDMTGQPEALSSAVITPQDYSTIIEFLKTNYYAKFPDCYSDKDVELYTSVAPEYLKWPSTRGIIYKKSGNIVATLFANEYDPHSALKMKTIHIGYWGYDRNKVTETEARWIKQHWFHSLSDWAGEGFAIDASFDCVNTTAIRLARSLGFQRLMLRLDRKVS